MSSSALPVTSPSLEESEDFLLDTGSSMFLSLPYSLSCVIELDVVDCPLLFFFSSRAAATVPGFGFDELPELAPFDEEEAPIPFEEDDEGVGGIANPYIAAILGSIPASILGSIPASIFGSKPIEAIILGSSLPNIFGSSPRDASILGSEKLANIFGSIDASIFGSMSEDNILGSI